MQQAIYLLCLCIIEIFSDFSLEKYANSLGGLNHLAAGVAGYMGVVFFLIKSLMGSSVLIVNTLYDGINSILVSLTAMLFFGQRLDNIYQYIGLFIIPIGLLLLKVKVKK
jgi:multidrug transporter EmrE-like cation transporter